MNHASVSLSRLMSPNVLVEWHDTVALVEQLVDQVAPDRARPPAGSVPPIEAIRLEPSGRLLVNLDPAAEPIVSGLGKLLNALLQSNPAPANLRLLAWQAASESAAPLGLDEFCRQLAGWERPGRVAALSALYLRASTAPPDVALPVRPVQGVAPLAEPPIATDPPASGSVSRRSRLITCVAAAACLVVPAATFDVHPIRYRATESVLASRTPGHEIAPPLTIDHPIVLPRTTVDRGLDDRAAARRVRRFAPQTTTPRVGVKADTAPASAIDTAPARAIDTEPARAIDTNREMPSPALLEPLPAEASIAIPATSEPSIFTSGDPAVAEPVLIRPYLPFHPHAGTPLEALGVLELVVDTRGMVESVHLKSPANRYRERWWVFAAKEWTFQPALKNGTAVRFLKRIPLTDLNMLEPQ